MIRNKWERRDIKRSKKTQFKLKEHDFQERKSAKKESKQKRAWAVLHRENDLDDEDDFEY